MKLQESAEMYLETILILSKKSPAVRSVDIAEALDYKKPSVSVAMKKLRENGFIAMGKDGHITLTEKGREVAETIYERHNLFANWLVQLGVDQKTAARDACRIEHVISVQSFDAIKKHVLGAKES
ncbi:MAG: metal-dependent transcriptional regulator [Christensenellales bacterium]